VCEYYYKSTGSEKKYHHNIKIAKYCDPKAFGLSVSVSRSGSFRDQLANEIEKVTDLVFREHAQYLPNDKIERS
jgi:hypothetical protein